MSAEVKPAEAAVSGDGMAEEVANFSPEEEADLIAESNSHKLEANTLFSSGKYNAAIAKYDEAAAVCPNYLDYEVAVLKSNIAACHLKLDEWKEAISSATAALDGLDKAERDGQEKQAKEEQRRNGDHAREAVNKDDVADEEVDEEIVSAGASKAGPALARQGDAVNQARRDDIARIRAKALMRRGRARSELGGWSNLEGALEDYKKLEKMENLSPQDRKIVQGQLRRLPPKAKAAQEKETAEMWGKLKDLGNGILKPFGLSTDNFQMVKDEKTGGYSMNFQSGAGDGSK